MGMPGIPQINPQNGQPQAPTPYAQNVLQALMLAGKTLGQPMGRPPMAQQSTPAVQGGPPPLQAASPGAIPGATNPLPPQTAQTPVLAGGQRGGGGVPIAPAGAANGFSFSNPRAAKTATIYDIMQSFTGLAKRAESAKQTKESNEAKYLLLELNNARSRFEQNPQDTKARDYYNELLADKRTQKVLKDVQGYSPEPMEGPPPAVRGAMDAAKQIVQEQKAQGQKPQGNPLASLFKQIASGAKQAGNNMIGRSTLPPAQPHPVPGPMGAPSNEQLDTAFGNILAKAPTKAIGDAAQVYYDASKFTPGGRVQAMQQTAQMFMQYAKESQISGDAIAKLNTQENMRQQTQNRHDELMLKLEDKRVAGASDKELDHDKALLEIQDKRDDTMLQMMKDKLDTKNAKPLTPVQRLNVNRSVTTADSMLKDIQTVLDNQNVLRSNSSWMKSKASGLPIVGRMVSPSKQELDVETSLDKRLPELVNQMRQAYAATGFRGHDAWQALQGLKGNMWQNPDVTIETLQRAKDDLQNLKEDANTALGAGGSKSSPDSSTSAPMTITLPSGKKVTVE